MKTHSIKFLTSLIFILMLFREISAQNIMLFQDTSGNANDTLEVSLNINNADSFVAFQSDIQLPSQVQYIANSAALTGRAAEHTLSATLIQNNTLRVFVFSMLQTPFNGNTGAVLNFKIKLKAFPGSYSVNLINSIISNSSGVNILTAANNGSITITAPDISVSSSSLDFGSVPLTQTSARNVTIYNNGNTALHVNRIYSDNPNFEVTDTTAIIVAASGNAALSLVFHSNVKGSNSGFLNLQSDDPDNKLLKVSLQAIAFAVNEIHVQNASGRSGCKVDIDFSINNMEAFTGFQFDLVLPNVLTYINNSANLNLSRKTDHAVSAGLIAGNKLRVFAYSSTNQAFKGSDGNILRLSFMLDGTGGNYPLNLENVIISNSSVENILSAYYNSFVNIASPDISGETSVNFGDIPVNSFRSYDYQLYNNGNDTLKVTSFSAPHGYFINETGLPQAILPGDSKVFHLKFQNTQKGTYTDKFTVRSNDPDEDPYYINVSANAFAPNYMSIENINAVVGDTVTLKICVDNYEEFVAFQTDLIVPDNMIYLANSCELTERKQGHALSFSKVSQNHYRLFAYSMNLKNFLGNSGAIAIMKFIVNSGSGNYPLTLTSVVLSNSASQNILKSAINGQVNVQPPSIKAGLKVYLQGAFNNGNMTTLLLSSNLIPLTQPYNIAPWNYIGTEDLGNIPNGVVDWVLVELRTGTAASTKVAMRAGLLKSDGMIVDIDGISPLLFSGLNAGNYYVVVRHRNHISIMSAATIALNSESTIYDFTSAQSKAYGTNPMKDLGGGKFGMISGDTDGNGIINDIDRDNIWNDRNQSAIYKTCDIDMNGTVNVLDRGTTWNNRNITSQVP